MTVRRSMVYVAIAALIIAPLAWQLRNTPSHGENARGSQCVNNLKQIGLGLHNYAATYGCFPPAYVADASGKPLYSWRVLIMAEMDRTEKWFGGKFASGFHFDEPWDSPANRKFHGLRILSLKCPTDISDNSRSTTNYLAVVGPGTLFPSDGTTRRVADVKDGAADTIMIVESFNSGIHWMEPRDLDWQTMSFQLNNRSRPSISSAHPYLRFSSHPGIQVLTVDNKASHLQQHTTPETLKSLFTVSGGEKIKRESWDGRR